MKANTKNKIQRKPINPQVILSAFSASLLDEKKTSEKLLRSIHKDKARCPFCLNMLRGKNVQNFWEGKYIRCNTCRKHFNALSGTCLSAIHATHAEIIIYTALLALGISDNKIALLLKRSCSSCRDWRKRFKI